MTRARHWGAVLAAITAGAALTALGGLLVAQEGRQGERSGALTVPSDDAIVVAELQRSGQVQSPELSAALRATRDAPEDLMSAQTAARQLIDEGRTAGDSRLVGAALGVLRPFMEAPEAETLYIAATARQYQHDFTGAMSLLDQAIDLDPRHTNALLTRATLHTVLGQLAAAQDDCRLVTELRQDVGFLCQSTALIATAQAPAVRDRLAQILARPGLLPASLEPWAIGLLGEIALLQGDDAEARKHLTAVLALNPNALRERLMLADLLLRSGEEAAVLPLLSEAPETDGVLLRRALAARALGVPDESVESALADRVRLNLDLGLDSHAREDAMFFLLLADDPERALERARSNWALQHEIEDAQLLIDGAVAAGQPAEALPVLDWMEKEGIAVPALRIPEAIRTATQ